MEICRDSHISSGKRGIKMKREKGVPEELLNWIEKTKNQAEKRLNTLDIFCTVPVRAVRMKVLKNREGDETFRTVIVPSVDVYTSNQAKLKKGCLKRDSLSYFIAGTRKIFPFGHIYADSGYLCLGTIFVPSAIPEKSVTMPIETLFLHNDRNLNHGHSHLFIDENQAKAVNTIIKDRNVKLSELAETVITDPGSDIIANDNIWILSADVVDQKSLPDALSIMSDVYDVVFPKKADR